MGKQEYSHKIAKHFFYAIEHRDEEFLSEVSMYRHFAERLNKELDGIGVPPRTDERIEVFAKLIKIPKFKAEAFLNGITIPDPTLLNLIAQELEVNPEWLIGKSEQRQKKTRA